MVDDERLHRILRRVTDDLAVLRTFATAQMAAIGERMETEWLRRLDLEAMAQQ